MLSLPTRQANRSIARWLSAILLLLPLFFGLQPLGPALTAAANGNNVPIQNGAPKEEEVHTHGVTTAAALTRQPRQRIPRCGARLCLLFRAFDPAEPVKTASWLEDRNAVPLPTDPSVHQRVLRGPPCA